MFVEQDYYYLRSSLVVINTVLQIKGLFRKSDENGRWLAARFRFLSPRQFIDLITARTRASITDHADHCKFPVMTRINLRRTERERERGGEIYVLMQDSPCNIGGQNAEAKVLTG